MQEKTGVAYSNDNIENICFKLTCYYMAITELFDRTLTDERSEYDQTKAFIYSTPIVRRLSNRYAYLTYRTITKIAKSKFKIPSYIFHENFKKQTKINHLSAQGWIDQYNFLCENGEMDFIKECL